MSGTEIKEGDKASWPWSGNRPEGTVAEVKEQGEVAIESHRGNTIKKNAEPDDPAVHLERPGNDVVKKASELDVEEKGPKHAEAKENGDAATGEKRKADDTAEEKKDKEGGAAKKKKTGKETKENGEAPKKKGRPAKKDSDAAAAPKKEPKKKEPKRAATESGEPRRSGRNAGK